jgi:hypothetical protein
MHDLNNRQMVMVLNWLDSPSHNGYGPTNRDMVKFLGKKFSASGTDQFLDDPYCAIAKAGNVSIDLLWKHINRYLKDLGMEVQDEKGA